jgi:PAS domain S-box-containing protein
MYNLTAKDALNPLSENLTNKYQHLLELSYAVPVGVVLADLSGQVQLMNGAMVNYLAQVGANVGLSSRLSNLYDALSHVLPDLQQHVMDSPLEHGVIINHQEVVFERDSHLFVASFQIRKLDSTRILMVMSDITTEAKAKREALYHQTRLAEVVKAVRMGLWEYNLGTGLLSVDNEYLAILGYGPHELQLDTAKSFDDLVHPDDLPELRAVWQEHISGQSTVQESEYEYRMRHKDGHWLWVLTRSCYAQPEISGGMLRTYGVQIDISERKKLQFEQQALIVEQQATEALQASKSQFLAGMSHELRTPLHGIKSMAHFLTREQVSDKDRVEFAQTILSSAKILATLLDDLFDMSQINAQNMQLRPETCDIHALLRQLVVLFTPIAQHKSIDLCADWHGPIGQLYRVDANRLRQMLTNLIGNAVKFTPAGFVHIHGKVLERHGNAAILEFSVKDSGVGIAEGKQAALFNALNDGTGLGLSIVKGLANRMGGSAGVASAEGQGACFWFQIHVVVENASELLTSNEVTSPLPTWQPNRAVVAEELGTNDVAAPPTAGTALVVDDNPINQKVLAQFLKEIDVPVLCVQDGLEAVNVIKQGMRPPFVVMDIQMPVMDGLEATRQIRQWEALQGLPRTPIIGLTAAAVLGFRDDGMQSGMDEVLFKPVDLDQLESTIERFSRLN